MDIDDCFQKLFSQKSVNSLKPWKANKSKELVLESICFTIEINGRFFIICTNHSVLNTQNNFIVNEEDVYKITGSKVSIPELDLCIIEEKISIKNITNSYLLKDINELNVNIKNIDNDIFQFIIPFNDNYMSLQCTIDKFTKMKYNNICFPEMPVFIGKLTGESIEKIKLRNVNIEGGSGTPIFKDNKLYGFLSGYYDSCNIVIIPIFMIRRIIWELLEYNKFGGLCKVYYDVDSLNSNTFIKNMSNVDCNANLKIKKKNVRLKKKDIILKLDGNTVSNKMVYDNNLKIYIDLDTYIVINKTEFCINNYLISRPNNKSNKIVQIISGNVSVNSILNINILSERINFYEINNKYIYAEICPRLFDLLIKYRNYSDADKIYSVMNPRYERNKLAILCDTRDNSYSIFNNETNNIDIQKLKVIENQSLEDLDLEIKCLKL